MLGSMVKGLGFRVYPSLLAAYAGLYQSEGFPLTGYFIPGHVGIWVWPISKLVPLLPLLLLLPCW